VSVSLSYFRSISSSARPTKVATVLHQGAKRKVRHYWTFCWDLSSSHGAGGPTYLAMAILRLVSPSPDYLSASERRRTLRWLLQNQDESGGFRGRTNKEADACYCFWCGAATQVLHSQCLPPFTNPYSHQILGAGELVDGVALASFIGNCQFRFGGIGKAPGENPGRDPCQSVESKF
jgi:prenyltransferase beta subunit